MKKGIMIKIIAALLIIIIFTSGAVFAGGDIIGELIADMQARISSIFESKNTQAVDDINNQTEEIIRNINDYNNGYENSVQTELSQFKDEYTNQKLEELIAIQNQFMQEMDSRKQALVDSYINNLKQNIDKEYEKNLDKMLKELTKNK